MIDSGVYQDAQAVVDRALEYFVAEEDWSTTNRDEIAAAIEEGLAQAERGELYSEEESRQLLAAEKKAWMAQKRSA